jgi:hypothetical protein
MHAAAASVAAFAYIVISGVKYEQKRSREIRGRFRPDKSMIGNIYGCYVNEDF